MYDVYTLPRHTTSKQVPSMVPKLTTMYDVYKVVLVSSVAPLSLSQVLATLNQVLESSSLIQRDQISVIIGIMEAGKTTLICRLLRTKLPKRYSSTGVANKAFRGLVRRIAQMGSLEVVSDEKRQIRVISVVASNTRCRRYRIIPRSLRVKPLVDTAGGRRIAARTSSQFLSARIDELPETF